MTPSPGLVCLAFYEECWYRAEVVKTSEKADERAQVFLLDYGKTVTVRENELRELDIFLDIPGLVIQVRE